MFTGAVCFLSQNLSTCVSSVLCRSLSLSGRVNVSKCVCVIVGLCAKMCGSVVWLGACGVVSRTMMVDGLGLV